MPQVFIVVRCFDCDTFQVQQSKKSPKWSCKMCGQKQSLKKVYGKGSGADCRKLVQSLNLATGELMESRRTSSDNQSEEYESSHEEEVVRDCSAVSSRWSNFLEQPQEMGLEDSNLDTEEPFNVVTERPHPVKRRHDLTLLNKKQRFQNQNTHQLSNSYTKNISEGVGSERHYQQKVSSFSSSILHFADINDFGEENDALSSSRNNLFTRENEDNKTSHLETETDKCHASKFSFTSNFKDSILQEKFAQQTNVSIPQKCLPIKRKREHETGLPKENNVKARTNNSKWGMFLTAEVDNSEDKEEKRLGQDYTESKWLKADLTIRPNECSKEKIFQVGDVLEDDLTWND